MSIILELPLTYSARVVQSGRRVKEAVLVVATAPFSIPEVDGEDTRFVAETLIGPGSKADFRVHNGKLLRPFPVGFGLGAGCLGPAPDPSQAAAYVKAWMALASSSKEAHWNFGPSEAVCRKPVPHFENGPRQQLQGLVRDDDLKARHYYNDDRDECIATMARVLEGIACIDGKLYVPTHGPCLQGRVEIGSYEIDPETHKYFYPVALTLDVIPDQSWLEPSQNWQGVFRVNENAHAMQALMAASDTVSKSRHDHRITGPAPTPETTVVDASALTDVRRARFEMAIRAAVRDMAQSAYRLGDDLLIYADAVDGCLGRKKDWDPEAEALELLKVISRTRKDFGTWQKFGTDPITAALAADKDPQPTEARRRLR